MCRPRVRGRQYSSATLSDDVSASQAGRRLLHPHQCLKHGSCSNAVQAVEPCCSFKFHFKHLTIQVCAESGSASLP